MNKTTPTRANVVVLKQVLNLIPLGMINRIARETGVADKSRSFTPASHLAAMLFAQLSRAMGLNCHIPPAPLPYHVHTRDYPSC